MVLNESKTVTLNVMKKLKDLDLYSIIISDCQDAETLDFFLAFTGSAQQVFTLPNTGPAMSALQFVIPLQRLAYDTTVALGYDPDRPRNLAKELTT